jgi:Cullin family/Cullin protein neddylation domain
MPRNKALMKKRATAPRKIIIKPFQKPPTLPPNYYEETSRELLDGTLHIIFGPDLQQKEQLSLQNSYQQVVNLVSHQYGPRLYQDLVATLQKACQEYVLPSHNDTLLLSNSGSGSSHASQLLGYIQTQYQAYVEYLLLCKHVFLPLDRAHGYTSIGTVVKRSAAAAAESSSNNKNNSNTTMDLWQVGLEQFHKRLQEFQWDDLIYQKWWTSLQLDWDDNLALDQQTLLQTTLYMWQDLGVVASTLSQQLEPDLIGLFQRKAQQLQQASVTVAAGSGGGDAAVNSSASESGNYNATAVISYCFDKWMHVAYHWSRFLPKSTCVFLLENHLFKPHLTSEWLLNPKHFDPILEDAFASAAAATPSAAMAAAASNATSTTTTSSSPIQQLWMLAGRLPGGYKLVGDAIAQYARSRGTALMSAMSNTDSSKSGGSSSRAAMAGKQKISDLLELQRQVRQLLSQLPQSTEYCQLKHVWEDVVNPSSDLEETNLVAEALAKYVDACLRDNKRQLSSSSSSSPLDGTSNWAEAVISGVFCYLQAKDVFEAFYKQDLAKRLLWNRIVSMDVERHFVSLLKAECGAGYTSKMEGMFQDMDWSRETMSRYKQTQFQDAALGSGNDSSGSNNSYKLEVDIQVLTTGYWPVYPQYPNLNLPQSLLEPQEKFTEYYKSKYQGRRMTWQYALGHLVVKFKPKEAAGPKYELLVSLCQALTLLQFNDADVLTLPQIIMAIGLEDRDEMERVLLSLSLGKEGTRVLVKRDHDAEKKKKTRMNVHDQDTFEVQSNFKSNQRRIRITNIMMKETKEEREKTVEGVSRDRLYLIDAVLVRIMKARKTILHQQLIPQVLEQVKVPAQPADIKKRIETLIEREYMERDAADRNRYNYLA